MNKFLLTSKKIHKILVKDCHDCTLDGTLFIKIQRKKKVTKNTYIRHNFSLKEM